MGDLEDHADSNSYGFWYTDLPANNERSMSTPGSVTQWLDRLKAGDHAAAQKFLESYYAQLVRLARARLGCQPRRVADEEDVAHSAFDSFCRGGPSRGAFHAWKTATISGSFSS